MKNIIFLILAIFTFTTCNNRQKGEQKPTILSNFVSISENEDKGVKEILEFYGGYCKYSIGFSTSSKSEKKKYFELELSKSEVIEELAKVVQMPASNIAYLFYRNLKSERNNYDEIHSVLIFADGEKVTFKYPTEQLELVDKRMKVANKIVDLIKNKDFDALEPLLNDTAFVTYDKNELIANLKNVDSQFGNITEDFRPFGFRIKKTNNGRQILHISGAIMRDKQNNEFSVDLDLDANNDEIFLLQYKL